MKEKTQPRCYVAGALNSDNAIGYIHNLHRMITNSEKVRKIGFAVFVPGIDILLGVVHGDWQYEDYFDNSQPWLDVSDCLYVTPKHENSKGTKREMVRAWKRDIPICFDLHSLKGVYLNKPTIICIIGESGTGKSLAADYICDKYGYSLIKSRTTRPPRTPDETGHTFVTDKEFDDYEQEDMLAYTTFGEHRYCCLKEDIREKNIYVIDEFGYDYLKDNFSDDYHIVSLRLLRAEAIRLREGVDYDRIQRDEGKFTRPPAYFDYAIYNNTTKEYLFSKIDEFLT